MEHQRLIDIQLNDLREKILSMGAGVQNALGSAMRSLIERDDALARRVVENDRIVDQMELEIDRFCIEILALRQPAAHDLRFVVAVAKITPILERIADHASSVAECALVVNREPELKKYVDLPLMAKTAEEMLENALAAFTGEDAGAARRIIRQDDVIDAAYKRVFNELIAMMTENPAVTTVAAKLLFAAKNLERVGDYVKDICELTVYMKEAVFIKHQPPGNSSGN